MARSLLIPTPENTTFEELKQLVGQTDIDLWFADESSFKGDSRRRKRWDKKGIKMIRAFGPSYFRRY